MGRVAQVAVVALGSNLGAREQHLARARQGLQDLLDHFHASRVIETRPVGVSSPQGPFLNQVAIGETDRPAHEVLAFLLDLERQAGRERPFAMAPRTLDLDLILYGNQVIHEAGLDVPHPRFRERAFVLDPLAELAPGLVDPVSGQTMTQLRDALRGLSPVPPGSSARRP